MGLAHDYALDDGGPKRLVVKQVDGDRYAVSLDGAGLRELARVPGVKQTVTLPDGSELVFEWRQGMFGSGEGWHITRNGVPLPGTTADPAEIAQAASAALFGAAILTAIGGVLAIIGIGFVRSVGGSPWALIDAAVLALAGWGTQRRSAAALLAGMAVFAGGTIYGFVQATTLGAHVGSSALTVAILIRVVLFVPMARAVPVLLKKRA